MNTVARVIAVPLPLCMLFEIGYTKWSLKIHQIRFYTFLFSISLALVDLRLYFLGNELPLEKERNAALQWSLSKTVLKLHHAFCRRYKGETKSLDATITERERAWSSERTTWRTTSFKNMLDRSEVVSRYQEHLYFPEYDKTQSFILVNPTSSSSSQR